MGPSGEERGVDGLAGLRVLVVEDEMLVSMMLEDMLADLGCTVVGPAFRVEKALALAETEAVDTAILDVNVAGEKIFPVADALAARGIPFAFATGYGESGVRDSDIGRPVLQKPFRREDLERILAESPRSGAAEK